MDLYLLRHANADWPNWKKRDDARPLTKRGEREAKIVAKFLRHIDARIHLVLTSPLTRAAQTARIVGEKLKIQIYEDQILAPGFEMANLKPRLETERERALMIVGHEPDFSEAVQALTGGAIKLSKAGIALVRFEPAAMKGKLVWLVSPREIAPSSRKG